MGGEEKKNSRLRDIIPAIGVMVSILIAGTSLLSSSGYIPSWWYHFSLIFLIALTFVIPFMVFYEPISKKYENFRIERKRNKIAKEHYDELRDLIDEFMNSVYAFSEVRDRLKNQVRNFVEHSVIDKEQKIIPQLPTIRARSTAETINLILNDIPIVKIHHWSMLRENPLIKNFDGSFRHFSAILEELRHNMEIMGEIIKVIRQLIVRFVKYQSLNTDLIYAHKIFREKYNKYVDRYDEFVKKLNRVLKDDRKAFYEFRNTVDELYLIK